MRTCETVSERQEALSEKLSRAADLLRTRVDVELEQGNRDLLQLDGPAGQAAAPPAADGRGALGGGGQLLCRRAHQLSGARRARRPGAALDPDLLAALAVPVVVVAIWLLVRRIRRRNDDA